MCVQQAQACDNRFRVQRGIHMPPTDQIGIFCLILYYLNMFVAVVKEHVL